MSLTEQQRQVGSAAVQFMKDTPMYQLYQHVAAPRTLRAPARKDWRSHEHGIAREYGPPIAWFKDPAGNILAIIQTA